MMSFDTILSEKLKHSICAKSRLLKLKVQAQEVASRALDRD